MKLPEKLNDAIQSFSKLPGIGGKSAQRNILYLRNLNPSEIIHFADAISGLKDLMRCKFCGIFSDAEICHICSDPKRSESKTICVVEQITDCLAIESSGHFKGLYHVLGGVLNPLLGIGPDDLSIEKLKDRVIKLEIFELILAINPSVEGDVTCSYINDELNEITKVERIGFGIPMGGNLEYLDPLTISKALDNKKKISHYKKDDNRQ